MSTEKARRSYGSSASAASEPAISNMAEHLVLMCASSLFAGISLRDCIEIGSYARPRTFMRGEALFSQGQPVCCLILLQSGCVKMTQLSPDGNEVLIWMCGGGELVNFFAGSTSRPHTCSARAMMRCRALLWDSNHIQALADRYPQLRMNILRIVTERLKELEERFREMATETVTRRLALNLLRLLNRMGTESKEGFHVSISREELAQMTGTTLFTISRVLSTWAESGFIHPLREAVLVSDLERLNSISFERNAYRKTPPKGLPEPPVATPQTPN